MGRIAGFGVLAIVLAVIANYIVLTLVVNVFGLPEFGAMSPLMVVELTALGVLLGTIVFAIVSRVAQQPTRVFTAIAIIALLLSFIPNILTLTGTVNLTRGFGANSRIGQQASTAGTNQSLGKANGTNAGTAGQNPQGNGQPTGRFQRSGQNFAAQRIPMALSLMSMHVVAFLVTLIVLTRAAASSTVAPQVE